MKIDELKESVGAAASTFTTLNRFDGFSEKQLAVIRPFYDNVIQSFFPGVNKRRFRADGEPRGFPDPYRYTDDARVAACFKNDVKDHSIKMSACKIAAAVMVANLCDRALAPADRWAIDEMCCILGYSVEEMNKFVHGENPSTILSMAGHTLRPLAVVLYRALVECMYEDCGLEDYIRFSSEVNAEVHKRAEEKRKIIIDKLIDKQEVTDAEVKHLLSEAANEAKISVRKTVKPAQVKSVKPKVHPKRDRFVALVKYLLEDKLLVFNRKPVEIAEWFKPGQQLETIAEDIQRPYKQFMLRRAQYEAFNTIPSFEAKMLHDEYDRFSWQLKNWLNEELSKLSKQMRREIGNRHNVGKGNSVPTSSARGSMSMPVDPAALEALVKPERLGPLGKPPMYGIPSKAIARVSPEVALDGKYLARVEALTKETDFREKTISDFCISVLDYGKELRESNLKIENDKLKYEVTSEILEGAFVAILMDDEAYVTYCGMSALMALCNHFGMPNTEYELPPLDDEDAWQEDADIGKNRKLESAVITNYDWIDGELEDGQIEGWRNIAVLSQLANRRIRAPITYRKSHVSLFKKLGLPERKARDYAVVLGTIRALNREAGDEEGELFHQVAFDVDVEEETDREKELRQMADEAIQSKRTVEREAQRLRHELAVLKREKEAQASELNQQIEKRDQLLGLYEARDDEDALGTDDDTGADLFPYYTDQKVVLYGGFESFRRDIERLMPGIRIIAHASHIDASPVRNADIVFIQINHTSHSNYWAVTDLARNNGVPFYHLNYAGAKRCAVEMVEKLKELKGKA